MMPAWPVINALGLYSLTFFSVVPRSHGVDQSGLCGFHASLKVRPPHIRGQREGQDKYENAA